MNILVLNSGSSSLKFSLYRGMQSLADPPAPESLFDGQLSGIGAADASLTLDSADEKLARPAQTVAADDSGQAIRLVLDAVTQPGMPPIDALGYRVVHPGPRLSAHTRITPAVLAELEQALAFAPLHDPAAVALIRQAMDRFPRAGHFACFDTVFHQTMPPEATTYPIPESLRAAGVHRYGFHGLSCESVVFQLRATSGLAFPRRLIIAHLGSGCSITAVVEGKSVDNTMGLTPTGGVLMGTRPGDLDPGLLFYLLRQPGATVDSVEHLLNFDSGLKALAGSGDIRKLRDAERRDPNAALALQIFVQSIRKTIAGFAALHGMDALVFTGGIGEHDPQTRLQAGGGFFGREPQIEPAANQSTLKGLRKISVEGSNLAVYIVPAKEDLMIARHVARLAASQKQ